SSNASCLLPGCRITSTGRILRLNQLPDNRQEAQEAKTMMYGDGERTEYGRTTIIYLFAGNTQKVS
ncbi:MAG: hypothetical protein ACOC9A_01175, partial [Candidatus Bipolaricaulota bacterium]